jgi:hypothetical protein
MAELKPDVSISGSSITVVVGSANCSIGDEKDSALSYSSMSYTLGAVIEAADYEPQREPSQPLRPNAVRELDSVLHTRSSENSILRDTSGEF